MKYIGKSSEDEMIAIFLSAEINSIRFCGDLNESLEKHKVHKKIIDKPDLKNDKENKLRKIILSEYRGYGKNIKLFENFPNEVEWEKVLLTLDDLNKIKYVNGSYWRNLSDGTRLAKIAVKKIIKNKTHKRILSAAKALSEGEEFRPLILVSTQKGDESVILEGHLRLTAYLIELKYVPKNLEAIIGYSPEFVKWNLF